MVDSKPLRCKKCGKPIGYITLTAKSYLQTRPDFDNVMVIGTCMDCASTNSFYSRNF